MTNTHRCVKDINVEFIRQIFNVDISFLKTFIYRLTDKNTNFVWYSVNGVGVNEVE